MRKAIRKFLDWLDARFPVKVTVTEDIFAKLCVRVDQLEIALSDRTERLLKCEQTIAAIKDAMQRAPSLAAQARAAYVATGRIPE